VALYLSVPTLLFVLGYSLAKRFTSLAHFWLGVSLMLAPVAAWVAIRGFVDMAVPLLLGGAVAFWVAGFDILYACPDAQFDKEIGLHSVPARFGITTSLRIAAVCHTGMFALLVGLYFASPHLGAIFLAGLGAVGALLIYEHRLVRPDDLTPREPRVLPRQRGYQPGATGGGSGATRGALGRLRLRERAPAREAASGVGRVRAVW
jgi:4-hydroxybenzoate polyprenyltransferase